jgi:hypothetical protein
MKISRGLQLFIDGNNWTKLSCYCFFAGMSLYSNGSKLFRLPEPKRHHFFNEHLRIVWQLYSVSWWWFYIYVSIWNWIAYVTTVQHLGKICRGVVHLILSFIQALVTLFREIWYIVIKFTLIVTFVKDQPFIVWTMDTQLKFPMSPGKSTQQQDFFKQMVTPTSSSSSSWRLHDDDVSSTA